MTSMPTVSRGRTLPPASLVNGVIDQGAVALLSFIVVGTASGRLSLQDFGLFALLNGTYVFAQAMEQALVSETMIVSLSGEEADRRVQLVQTVCRRSVFVCVAFAAASIGIAFALSHRWSIAALFGVVTMLGLSSDVLRGALIATERTRRSAVLSSTSVLVLTLAVLLGKHGDLLESMLIAWGASFVVPALFFATPLALGIKRMDGRDRMAMPMADRTIRVTLTLEAFLAAGALYLSLLAVDHFASRGEAGAVRLAMALMGPVSVLFNVIRLNGVAELRRASERSSPIRTASMIGLAAAGVALISGALLWSVPARIGQELLGETWIAGHQLLAWSALQRAAIGLTLGPSIVLRARHVMRSPLVVRVIAGTVSTGAAAVGAGLLGGRGALLGLSFGAVVQTCGLGWILLREKGV
jgi:O-antigen/teichoic acid export membrane protein